MFFLLTLAMAEAGAAVAVPRQKLAVSFDLEKNLLAGKAEIEIPAGLPVAVSVAGFTVREFIQDGIPATLAEGKERIELAASASGHRLIISYEKQARPEEPQGGLISAAGIVLLGDWHPTLDVAAIYALTARLPAGFEAVSEADRIEKKEEDGGAVFSFVFPHPLPALDFIAGPYQVSRAAFGDGKELYTYFFPEDADLVEHYRDKALGYLARYEKLIGPYPYQRFSIVENRLPTGYAMPTFTLLGQAVVRLPFIVDTSLGHEVLHAWFGNAVSPAEGFGNWSEGLASYLADAAFAEEAGEGLDYRKGQLIRLQSFTQAGGAVSLREFAGADTGGGIASQAVRAVGYDKGAMVFHLLRQAIGDEAFFAGLRDLYRRLKYQQAGWDDLVTSFEEAAHVSLKDFFVQWTERSDVPVLVVEDPRIEEEDGMPVASFTLKQMTENPYRLSVPVEFRFSDNSVVKRIIDTDAKEKEVAVPLGRAPRLMAVDPGYNLLRRLAPNELPPVWSRFVGAAKKLAVRAGKEDPAVYAPLEKVLADLGCEIKNEDEVKDADLAAGAVLFLGLDSDRVRTLFGRRSASNEGMTVDVRPHPLLPGSVAVLVAASSSSEVLAAAGRLKHYGKYGFLRFASGRAVEKRIEETASGQVFLLDEPPVGIAAAAPDPFDAIVTKLAENRVVYVGESHTTMSDHALQLRVIRALHEKDSRLAIGMEMFSRDAQPVLDEYIAGGLNETEFMKKSGYFDQWGYDYRLYRDILRYARRHRLNVIGLNLAKNVVSKVFREGGVDALAGEEAAKLPRERDLDVPGYQQRLAGVFAMHGKHGVANAGNNAAFKDFFQAQALWDETMAETAAEFVRNNPEHRLVVLAGRGHVVKDSGIPPRLLRRLPGIAQTVVVNGIDEDGDSSQADFIFFAGQEQLPPAPVMGVRLKEEKGRVIIADAADKSAAANAGAQAGDVIISMDGATIAGINDLKILMLDKNAGDPLKVMVERTGFFGVIETVELRMTL